MNKILLPNKKVRAGECQFTIMKKQGKVCMKDFVLETNAGMFGIIGYECEGPVETFESFWVQKRSNDDQHRKLRRVEIIGLAANRKAIGKDACVRRIKGKKRRQFQCFDKMHF